MFQGAILGPLLLLTISDLHVATKYSKVHHFADETNLMKLQTSVCNFIKKKKNHQTDLTDITIEQAGGKKGIWGT